MRRALGSLGRLVRRLRGVSRAPAPARAARPPRRLFRPRLVQRSRELSGGSIALVTIHGRELELCAPVDWHPRGGLRDSPHALAELHGMEWLEGLEPDEAALLALDWIAHNRLEGRAAGQAGWHGNALARRGVVWMQQVALRERALGPDLVETLTRSVAVQLRCLELHLERERGSLLRIDQARALLWGGRFFEGPEAERWARTAEALLASELEAQVGQDGMHGERSPALHLAAFASLLECRTVLANGALSGRLDALLERMAQATADLTHPDGGVSLLGEGGRRPPRSPAECLEVHGRLCGREVAPRAAFGLEDTGFYGVRSGASLLVFDAGPQGVVRRPEGCGADVFAFEWSVDGRRIVVDAGTADGGPAGWRALARATSAHNTVTIEGRDQQILGPGRSRRARVERKRYERFGSSIVVEGEHAGYAHLRGRPRHTRRITATAHGVSVEDFIEGGEGQQVRAGLLLHPDVEVRKRGRTVVLVCGPLVAVLETRHPLSVVPSWWFPEPGVKRATLQVVLRYPDAPGSGKFRLERLERGSTRWHLLRREARPFGQVARHAEAA